MATTKIINVSGSDSFSDVFEVFRDTPAEEVIFIFPKVSKFTGRRGYFEAIKEEADAGGKSVSVMTADPLIARLAGDFGFELLGASAAMSKENNLTADIASVQFLPPSAKKGDFETEDEADEDEEDEDENAVATLTASRPRAGGMMRDVVPKLVGRNLRIKRGDDDFDLEVRDERAEADDSEDDIVKVWRNPPQRLRRAGSRRFNFNFRSRRALLTALGGLIIVALLVLYSALARATVTIRPQKQNLDFRLKIIASTETAAVNLEFGRVPGQQFSAQKEETETFPATGQKNIVQKAGGRIAIYNPTSTAQRLVATTRFESPDGLIFRIPQTIAIPAGTKDNPGSIESVVSADRPGPDYNIGPTKFTIPGFKGTAKFDQFYAVSNEPMSGGVIGPSKIVTEGDFSKAREILIKKVKDQILKTLKAQAGDLKVIESADIKLDEPAANVKAGEAAAELKMTVKGAARTLAFREPDIIELVKNKVAGEAELDVLEKKLVILYQTPILDSSGKNMSFTAQVNGVAAARIDLNKIVSDILGSDEEAIRTYFKGLKEVESARVTLTPFWVKRIPRDANKVRVEIQFD